MPMHQPPLGARRSSGHVARARCSVLLSCCPERRVRRALAANLKLYGCVFQETSRWRACEPFLFGRRGVAGSYQRVLKVWGRPKVARLSSFHGSAKYPRFTVLVIVERRRMLPLASPEVGEGPSAPADYMRTQPLR
jgi:hypothetical protein